MIHYSCDRCRRMIDAEQEIRYSVQIETHAALDPISNEAADDRDHLVELQNILEQLDETDRAEISANVYQRQRFDLCPECHRQFTKNPLSIDNVSKLEFSDN